MTENSELYYTRVEIFRQLPILTICPCYSTYMPIHKFLQNDSNTDYFNNDYNHYKDDDQCVMHDEQTETETEKREKERQFVR